MVSRVSSLAALLALCGAECLADRAMALGSPAGLQAAGNPWESSTLSIPLAGRVTIVRSAEGSPHVMAESERAGYAGLCYAMAQDRLFQMDILRRAAMGRLSEFFGPDTLEQDQLTRLLGLQTIAKDRLAQSSQHTRMALEACAKGITAYIASAIASNSLPREFAALSYAPKPWSAEDSALMLVYLNASFDMAVWQTKLQMSLIAANHGTDIMNALIPAVPDSPSLFDASGNLNPLPTADTEAALSARTRPRLHAALATMPGAALAFPKHPLGLAARGWKASNHFAVDGTLTASGKPIVANDPHLQLAVPSLLYQAQLKVPGYNVAGLLLPGVPAFMIGHNDRIAWTVSASGVDATDLYLETLANDQVLFRRRWVPVRKRVEIFHVAGTRDVTVTFRDTPHGPILNDAMPTLAPFGTLALRSGNANPEWRMDGLFDMASATSWEDFRRAARNVSFGFNYIVADNSDAHGHIGFQLAALAPQRPLANAEKPVPGDSGGFEWTRFASFDELPSAYDPPSHMLAAANNRIVPDDYAPKGMPVYLTTAWDEPWRAQRALSRLSAIGHPITVGDLQATQLDTTTTVAVPLTAEILQVITHTAVPQPGSRERWAYDALAAWDYDAAAGSLGATVYETLSTLLQRDLALGVLGADLYQNYATLWLGTQLHGLLDILRNPRAPFFGATGPADAATKRDAAVAKALTETVRLLAQALGQDTSAWTWGALHTLTYNHPLAGLDPLFALPTYPSGGDVETLNTGGWFLNVGILALPPGKLAQAGGAKAAFAQDGLASARAVMDLANFNASGWVLSTGSSGDPYSPHYADQAALWRTGLFLNVPFLP